MGTRNIRMLVTGVLLFSFIGSSVNAEISNKGSFSTVSKSVVSKDGTGFSYIFEQNSQYYVLANGKKYGPYEGVDAESFQYTNVGNSFGYIATQKEKQVVNIDGKTYGPYDTITEFKFETDQSNVFSFRYSKDSNNYVNINAKAFGPYEQIDSTIFSEDGISYGFSYKKGEKYYININGEEFGESYDWIGDLIIAKEGGRFGFAYSKAGKYYVNINKKEYGPYDTYTQGELKMSPDGTKFTFLYGKDEKSSLVINGVEYPKYASVSNLFTSLDFTSFIYTFTNAEGATTVNANDKMFGPYPAVEQVSISQDGKNFAFVYDMNVKDPTGESEISKKYVNISGTVSEIKTPTNPEDGVPTVTMLVSQDGVAFGYQTSLDTKNVKFFYIDGKEYGSFFKISVKSYNNKKWGIGVTDSEGGSDFVFINGNKFGPFDEGELEAIIFNSDETGYIYNYKKNDKRYLNVTGVEYGPYDQLDAIKFSADGKGFSYRYALGDKWYIKLNDKDYGPYERSDYLNYGADGKTFNFRFEKNDKRYINLNGKEYGPYDSFIDLKFAQKNIGAYGFMYKNTDFYAVVNNTTYGPYTDISDLMLSDENWGFIFKYKSGDQMFANYNGNSYGPCEDIKDLSLSGKGNTHTFTCLKKEVREVVVNDLSKIDKERMLQKDSIKKMLGTRLKTISKTKLESISLKVEKMKEGMKKKTSKSYQQLELISEIFNEEILSR